MKVPLKEPSRSANPEYTRRLWHSSIGIVVILLYWGGFSTRKVFWGLFPVTLVYGGIDWYRLRDANFNELFINSFPLSLILRKCEREKMTTSFHFLLGAQLALLLFSRPVAALSLLYLSWCDPFAGFIGFVYGPKKVKGKRANGLFWNGKSYIGTVAAAGLGVVITFFFLLVSSSSSPAATTIPKSWIDNYQTSVITTSILGGLIAAGAELINIGELDDNLTMPLLSGMALSLVTPIGLLYAEGI